MEAAIILDFMTYISETKGCSITISFFF